MKTILIAIMTLFLWCSLRAQDMTNNAIWLLSPNVNYNSWLDSGYVEGATNNCVVNQSLDAEESEGFEFHIRGKGYTNIYVVTKGQMILKKEDNN